MKRSTINEVLRDSGLETSEEWGYGPPKSLLYESLPPRDFYSRVHDLVPMPSEAKVPPVVMQPSQQVAKDSATIRDSNPKTIYGQAKPPLGLIPGAALVHIAEALRDGADKYGPANWRHDPVSQSTYYSACLRHMTQWQDGEDLDTSTVHHLGHAAANLCILLDAMEAGTLIDDRPPPSRTAELIRAKTRGINRSHG